MHVPESISGRVWQFLFREFKLAHQLSSHRHKAEWKRYRNLDTWIRSLTLDNTVEFCNQILELKLTSDETTVGFALKACRAEQAMEKGESKVQR